MKYIWGGDPTPATMRDLEDLVILVCAGIACLFLLVLEVIFWRKR